MYLSVSLVALLPFRRCCAYVAPPSTDSSNQDDGGVALGAADTTVPLVSAGSAGSSKDGSDAMASQIDTVDTLSNESESVEAREKISTGFNRHGVGRSEVYYCNPWDCSYDLDAADATVPPDSVESSWSSIEGSGAMVSENVAIGDGSNESKSMRAMLVAMGCLDAEGSQEEFVQEAREELGELEPARPVHFQWHGAPVSPS